MSAFFEILKTFQVITIKLRRFRLRKCYFGGFGCKIQTKHTFKNADTVLDCEYSVKYENVVIGAIKRNTSDLELNSNLVKIIKIVNTVYNCSLNNIRIAMIVKTVL